jgi:hypothetical protein
MAKVTWLGEDEMHKREDGSGAGPSFVVWNGQKFPKDVPVDVTNPIAIAKAKGNPFFKVEGLPGRPRKEDVNGDDNG